jgi:hypothetical protein
MRKAPMNPAKQGTKVKKKTSIGRSRLSRPLNKYKKRDWKKYRGQGK